MQPLITTLKIPVFTDATSKDPSRLHNSLKPQSNGQNQNWYTVAGFQVQYYSLVCCQNTTAQLVSVAVHGDHAMLAQFNNTQKAL
jgi:hypothetical protein